MPVQNSRLLRNNAPIRRRAATANQVHTAVGLEVIVETAKRGRVRSCLPMGRRHLDLHMAGFFGEAARPRLPHHASREALNRKPTAKLLDEPRPDEAGRSEAVG
jgi:hypothetical protein